jgi:hypothetical protein
MSTVKNSYTNTKPVLSEVKHIGVWIKTTDYN